MWLPCCDHRAHLGQAERALADAEAGLIAWRALGAEAFVPCNQTQLAEIRLVLGDLNEAMRLVDEAVASAEKRGERFFLAESHRVRAAILRRRADGDRAEVRRELETSRTIAASQGALVFELRAPTDLVELGGTDADVEDLSRLLDRFPAASRPLGTSIGHAPSSPLVSEPTPALRHAPAGPRSHEPVDSSSSASSGPPDATMRPLRSTDTTSGRSPWGSRPSFTLAPA